MTFSAGVILGLLCAFAVTGCGVTGNTSRMTVPLDAIPSAAELRPVKVASFGYEKEWTKLMSVGVFHWGAFDESDRVNLTGTLEDTLEAATRGKRSTAAPLEIHVMIRTYLIAASGREGLVIAGVDWSAAEPDKRVLFQEAFYAAYTCGTPPNFCTIGINKDAVHRAIVKRIAQDALALAAGGRPGARVVEKTYAKLEEAAAVVPKSLGQPGEVLPTNRGGYALGGVAVPVEDARMIEPIDWSKRLMGIMPAVAEDMVNCVVKGQRQWTRRSECD